MPRRIRLKCSFYAKPGSSHGPFFSCKARKFTARLRSKGKVESNMKKFSVSLCAAITLMSLAGCASVADGSARQDSAKPLSFAAKKTMRAFRSEQELAGYLKELAEKQREEEKKREGMRRASAGSPPLAT